MRSIVRVPWIVLIRIGKKVARNTRKIAGLLATPNQTIASGIQETGGTGRSSWMVGSIVRSIRRDQPIAMPRMVADTAAMPKPANTRKALAVASRYQWPL